MKISSINAYGQRNIYQQRKAVQHPSITVPEAPNRAFRFRGNTVLQKALPESQDCSERLERSEAF